MLHEIDDAPQTLGTLVEAWGLELPADTGHTLRYMPPETTDNTVLWVKTNAGWQQAETSVDGSYLTCTAPAGTTAFAAVQAPASKVPLLAAACGAAAALLLVILFIARKRKKRKEKKLLKSKIKENPFCGVTPQKGFFWLPPLGKLSPKVTDEGSLPTTTHLWIIMANLPLIRRAAPPSPLGEGFSFKATPHNSRLTA